jgi:hypothetical protein
MVLCTRLRLRGRHPSDPAANTARHPPSLSTISLPVTARSSDANPFRICCPSGRPHRMLCVPPCESSSATSNARTWSIAPRRSRSTSGLARPRGVDQPCDRCEHLLVGIIPSCSISPTFFNIRHERRNSDVTHSTAVEREFGPNWPLCAPSLHTHRLFNARNSTYPAPATI